MQVHGPCALHVATAVIQAAHTLHSQLLCQFPAATVANFHKCIVLQLRKSEGPNPSQWLKSGCQMLQGRVSVFPVRPPQATCDPLACGSSSHHFSLCFHLCIIFSVAAPPASLWILWLPWVYPGNPGYPPPLSIPDLLNLLSPLCHGRQHSPGFQELGCGYLGEGGHYSASLSPVPSSLPYPCASVSFPMCLPCVPLLIYIMQERRQFTQRNIQFWKWS